MLRSVTYLLPRLDFIIVCRVPIALMLISTFSLLAPIDDHIESIQPTTLFYRPKALRSSLIDDSLIGGPLNPLIPTIHLGAGNNLGVTASGVNISCNATITPQCLQDLYGFGGYTPSAHSGNQLGVAGYLEQYANFQDLQTFYAQYVSNKKKLWSSSLHVGL